MTVPQFLLDKNVLIALLKGHAPARVILEQNGARPELSAVSQITRMELMSFHGLSADEEIKIKSLLSAVQVILIDETIELAAIQLRRRFRLKLPDAIVGATSIAFGLKLITLDQQLTDTMSQA